MNPIPFRSAVALALSAMLLLSCSQRDESASAQAAAAATEYQRGNYIYARTYIRRALALRDDVSDYWLLLGRVSMQLGDVQSAFDAYETVLSLDRANVEALRTACRLGVSLGIPDKVNGYADQLLLLNSEDPLALATKGGLALRARDRATAKSYAQRILATSPSDIDALILKSRVLLTERSYTEAAKTLEASLRSGGDPASRLELLAEIYGRAGNRAAYENTLTRLAKERQIDATVQLQFAGMLFEVGRRDTAHAVLRHLMRSLPNDVATAGLITDLLVRAGPDAIDTTKVLATTQGLSLEMRAAYAQYVDEIGHPDLAIAILGNDVAAAPAAPENLNAKASYAFALALRGKTGEARQMIADALAVDGANPRALLVRSRLAAVSKDFTSAIADTRKILSDDPRNASARLLLSDYLLARGDDVLALSALREGARAAPADTRIAEHLAMLLIAKGKKEEAAGVLRALAFADPVSLRAKALRTRLCGRIGTAGCDAPIDLDEQEEEVEQPARET